MKIIIKDFPVTTPKREIDLYSAEYLKKRGRKLKPVNTGSRIELYYVEDIEI